MLRNSPEFPRSPAIQPGVPALRGSDDQDARIFAYRGVGMRGAQAQGAGRLDGHGARGEGSALTGQGGCVAYWPGIRFGVRGPTPDETPLSWEEVQLGFALGVLQ